MYIVQHQTENIYSTSENGCNKIIYWKSLVYFNNFMDIQRFNWKANYRKIKFAKRVSNKQDRYWTEIKSLSNSFIELIDGLQLQIHWAVPWNDLLTYYSLDKFNELFHPASRKVLLSVWTGISQNLPQLFLLEYVCGSNLPYQLYAANWFGPWVPHQNTIEPALDKTNKIISKTYLYNFDPL